jgi:ribose/xylose/arabinose/galactoside ABC-type transport system permease subunit
MNKVQVLKGRQINKEQVLNRKGFDYYYEKYGVYITLVSLVVLLSFLSPNFFTVGNGINILRQCAIYMVLAFGVTFVFIGGYIDLSVGYNICFSSVIFALLIVEAGVNIWIALFITVAVGAAIGAFNAFVVSVLKVNFFLATLGTMYLLRGAALVISNETPITGLPDSISIFGGITDFPIPPQVIIAAIVFIILVIVLNYTKLGRYTFAIGSNQRAARLSGVNVRGITFFDFMVAGACAALCGVIITARLKMGSATIVSGYELDAIAAVCIGGTSSGGGRGSLFKTMAGALTLTVMRVGLNILHITTATQYMVIGAIIIVVVSMDMHHERKNNA